MSKKRDQKRENINEENFRFQIHVGMSREDKIIEFKWKSIMEVSLELCEVILYFAIFDLGVGALPSTNIWVIYAQIYQRLIVEC